MIMVAFPVDRRKAFVFTLEMPFSLVDACAEIQCKLLGQMLVFLLNTAQCGLRNGRITAASSMEELTLRRNGQQKHIWLSRNEQKVN